jgi:hypothetical protein
MDRYQPSNFDAIKDRAIALLQSGAIEGRSIDDLRRGERCILNWAIRHALSMAIEEVISHVKKERGDRRRAVLLKSEYKRAVTEITALVMKDPASEARQRSNLDDRHVPIAGVLVARCPIQPQFEYRVTQKLLDLFWAKNGKPVETRDELVALVNAAPVTLFSSSNVVSIIPPEAMQ